MPARPEDNEYVWKVYEVPAEEEDPAGESSQTPQSGAQARRKVC